MEKYLPVGTVCTLNKTNKKYIIMGYFSLEYNSNIKMYDYVGVPYPEGLLLHNKTISFNHDDISKVEFMGYSDENFRTFNKKIKDQSHEVEFNEYENGVFGNFSFDENGVVVYEYSVDYNQDEKNYNLNNLSTENLENPFNQKYDIDKTDNNPNDDSWTVFKDYSFDENGNVISEDDVVFSDNNQVMLEKSSNEKIYVDDEIVFVKNDNYSQLMFDKEGNVLIAEPEESNN